MNSLQVLYKGEQFIIIDKPFDLKINSNDPEDVTVETILLERGVRCEGVGGRQLTHSFYWVHRLDYATSGVLCIGLTKEAARQATQAFEKRMVRKCYLALVRGHVCLEEIAHSHTDTQLVCDGITHLDVCASLVRDRTTDFPYIFTTHNSELPVASECTEKVLSASTSVYMLESGSYEGEKASKLLLVPHTGRSHQLRVHCKYIGHTIVGDYTYSSRADTQPHRMMLHACSIHIPTTEDIRVTTEDPFVQNAQWLPSKQYTQLGDLMSELGVEQYKP